MLREDKRAQIEKQLLSKAPIYASKPPPKSTLEQVGRVLGSKQYVAGWNETYIYELSSGKPTAPTARASTYMSVKLTAGRFNELSAAQLVAPVLVTTWEGKNWWWYLNRFWWDAEGLTPADVQALILQREHKKQATLERARNQALGIETKGAGLEVSSQRIRDFAERERKQRVLQERLNDVEGRNANLEATISALENLLREALDRDSTVAFDPDDGDPDGLVSYFSSVLDGSPYPEGFPKKHRVAFVPESRQLVVEYELPTLTIVPAVKAYKHVASRSAIWRERRFAMRSIAATQLARGQQPRARRHRPVDGHGFRLARPESAFADGLARPRGRALVTAQARGTRRAAPRAARHSPHSFWFP